MTRKYKVRDKRNRGWFYLDNQYFNGYSHFFGATGTAIYVALCRHAGTNQTCFPSQDYLSMKLGVSRRTIIRYLKKLEEWNIIAVEKERKNGKWLNNVYILLDKTEWKKPSDLMSHGYQVTIKTKPCDTDDLNHVTQGNTKNTNRKNTNRKKERFINQKQNKAVETIKKEIRKKYTNSKEMNTKIF